MRVAVALWRSASRGQPCSVASSVSSISGLKTTRRLPIGQGTVNYWVCCVQRDVFVKCYPTAADLSAEREAIALPALAGRHGVPIAALVPTAAGEPISARGPLAISVWEWVEGRTITDRLTTTQQRVAGAALGHHRPAASPHHRT
jgi:Ser/Thr protein kinase RdoA (MazF antagonist)